MLKNAHLPFDKPFDKLTVLSNVEGLTVLSNVEGLTDLSKPEEPFDRLRPCPRLAQGFTILS
jgi:hypothetical protein